MVLYNLSMTSLLCCGGYTWHWGGAPWNSHTCWGDLGRTANKGMPKSAGHMSNNSTLMWPPQPRDAWYLCMSKRQVMRRFAPNTNFPYIYIHKNTHTYSIQVHKYIYIYIKRTHTDIYIYTPHWPFPTVIVCLHINRLWSCDVNLTLRRLLIFHRNLNLSSPKKAQGTCKVGPYQL